MGSITILETNDVDLARNGSAAAQSWPTAQQVMTYNPGCRPGYIHDDLAFEHLAVFKDIQTFSLQTARMTRMP